MQLKTDTRERFHVITVQEHTLSANMTELIENKLFLLLNEDVKNVVLNLKDVHSIDNDIAQTLIKLQREFYEQKASFVVCCLQPEVHRQLAATGVGEEMNTTPTESEAGEIVMMEEIERELDL
jgi:anti-anti-sigma factor